MLMRLITIAIHTFPYALQLKHTLEEAGIDVVLQNVNLEQPIVSPGVRVRIHEHDLAKALRIIEVPGTLVVDEDDTFFSPMAQVLVPTDFSPSSEQVWPTALAIAAAHDTGVLILHSYVNASIISTPPLTDSLEFDTATAIEDRLIDSDQHSRLHALDKRLKREIAEGVLPKAVVETRLTAGVPEESIAATAKEIKPLMIVMGTRPAATKEREVVGSVTAEVLDTVRFPVLSIPENVNFKAPADIRHITFFTMPDQQDIVAIDAMSRLMPLRPGVEVTIVNAPSRTRAQVDPATLDALAGYCSTHYPRMKFNVRRLTIDELPEAIRALQAPGATDLVCIPTRKRSLLRRFFNPTFAHRLIFKADLPILSIPV